MWGRGLNWGAPAPPGRPRPPPRSPPRYSWTLLMGTPHRHSRLELTGHGRANAPHLDPHAAQVGQTVADNGEHRVRAGGRHGNGTLLELDENRAEAAQGQL